MSQKRKSQNLIKPFLFLVPGVVLAYLSLITRWEFAVLSLLGLGILYVLMRPFSASIKTISLLCIGYFIIGGVLNLAQPIAVDSWPLFAAIVMISMALQPLIFLLIIDAVLRLLEGSHRVYDMAVVVLLWLSTLIVTFGSTALLHGSSAYSFNIYLLFMVPWIINGFVFFIAAFLCFLIVARRKRARQTKRPKK